MQTVPVRITLDVPETGWLNDMLFVCVVACLFVYLMCCLPGCVPVWFGWFAVLVVCVVVCLCCVRACLSTHSSFRWSWQVDRHAMLFL